MAVQHNSKMGFHNFVIDAAAAVSNVGSELPLLGTRQWNHLAVIMPAAWDAADIAFEVQFQHETTPAWRRVDINNAPVRVQQPTVDNVCIGDAECETMLHLPINRLRIRSVNNSTFADVNQAAERIVRILFTI